MISSSFCHQQRNSFSRGFLTPVFLLEPPTKYHFSNNTGGVLNCAGTSGGSGRHGTPVEVSWTTNDHRPVHPVITLDLYFFHEIMINSILILKDYNL